MRQLFRKPLTWAVLTVAVAGLVVGLALFEPWRLFTSSHLDEPLPVAAASEAPPVPVDQPQDTPQPPPAPAGPQVLAEGAFVTQEHDTSGTARVLVLEDGSRILRLEGFSTSDGPDLHVWLAEATAGGDWYKADDRRHISLGEMKATDGNHNYVIPADADLADLQSVVIWCDRFNVAFGSAPLAL